MTNISSQDFRNAYEKFYVYMREYLWPYSVLKELGEVETIIYSAFIDLEQLRNHFNKLKILIKDTYNEDELIKSSCDALEDLIEIKEPVMYSRLARIQEVNPNEDKQLRTIPESDKEGE